MNRLFIIGGSDPSERGVSILGATAGSLSFLRLSTLVKCSSLDTHAAFSRWAAATACSTDGILKIAQFWMTATTIIHQKLDQHPYCINVCAVDD